MAGHQAPIVSDFLGRSMQSNELVIYPNYHRSIEFHNILTEIKFAQILNTTNNYTKHANNHTILMKKFSQLKIAISTL